LITPGISSFFEALVSQGHKITLQSNLKARMDAFTDVVSPEDTSWILVSVHSVAIKDFEKILKKVTWLKERGYPVVVKFLLDDPMMTRFAEFHDELVKREIGTMCSPIINYPPGARAFPKTYSADEWSIIAPRITLRSSWLFFAGGWVSNGSPCYAGDRMFYLRAVGDGSIYGCSSGSPAGLGNLFTGELAAREGLSSCGLDSCICDFHYYTGIIPNLDDSGSFESLAIGQIENVPFDDYLDWVRDVQPCVDLRPAIREIDSGSSGYIQRISKLIHTFRR
jgi:hypothetical protein